MGYTGLVIGILAIQGDFLEHEQILDKLGLPHKQVRTLKDTEGLTGFIIPGGESTVMGLFMKKYGFDEWLKAKAPDLKIYGTCAGLILLARYGLLDVEVQRNAYGRQSASFMTAWPFIRAPKIKKWGRGGGLAEERGVRFWCGRGRFGEVVSP